MSYLLFAESPPAPLFSTAFRAEAERFAGRPGLPEIYPVMSLAIDGATRYYSKGGLPYLGQGNAEGRVTRWGSIVRSVSPRSPNIVNLQLTPELADQDRVMTRLLAAHRRSGRLTPAEVRLVSPRVPDADAFTAFSGVLEGWELLKPYAWKLSLRPNDRALRSGEIPRAAITSVDWPNAHTDALAEYYPLVYGIHDSNVLTNKGMVPCLYVDTLGFRYLVQLGHAKTVRAVYKDGAIVSSGYSVVKTIINGKAVTLIDFTTAQGSSAITADVEGFTDRPDGTGSLISNPADQLLHFLVNFVFGDWRSGAYLSPETAPLHVASFAASAAFLAAKGHEGSKRIGGTSQAEAQALLSQWLDDHDLRALWTFAGRLAVKPIDHRPRDAYGNPRRWYKEALLSRFSIPSDTEELTRKISVEFLYNSVEGRFTQTQEVADVSVPDNVTTSKQLHWSPARVV